MGVGAELEAAFVVELFDRVHQSLVALLDEVEEAQAAPLVLFGDRHDQSQVGVNHAATSHVGIFHDPLERAAVTLGQTGGLEPLFGFLARLDAPRQVDFLGPGQERHSADFAQVVPYRVGGVDLVGRTGVKLVAGRLLGGVAVAHTFVRVV